MEHGLLLLALGALATGHTFEVQIIGGHTVTPHSRPYMASLQKDHTHLCGGVLVHPRWVLTAAHCMTQQTRLLKLVLGLHTLGNPDDRGLTFSIKTAILHPHYKPEPALENDLALLKLDSKVKSTRTIRPLSLPQRHHTIQAGARCSVAGWGLTHHGGRPAHALQELDVGVMDIRMCNNSRFWNGEVSGHMICLEPKVQDQGPCKGDSGGPLVCKDVVAGILSFGSKACTDVFKPPVATAVGPYMPWIRKTIGR